MKTSVSKSIILCFLSLMLSLPFATGVYATDYSEIAVGETQGSNVTQQKENSSSKGNIADALKDLEVVKTEDVARAKTTAAPLIAFIGNIVGLCIVALTGYEVFITPIDMIYLRVTVLQDILGGGPRPDGSYRKGIVSGEARKALMLSGEGSQMPQQQTSMGTPGMGASSMGMMGGMGSMGGFGMNRMGGMGGFGNQMQPQQQNQAGGQSSAISIYIKKKTVVLILTVVGVLVLTSSALLGTGIDIASAIITAIEKARGVF